MTGWAVVAIVAIVMSGIVRIFSLRHGGHEAPRPPAADDRRLAPDEAETRREIADLRERLKVLERIATDGHSVDAAETRRIAAEIEALRSPSPDGPR